MYEFSGQHDGEEGLVVRPPDLAERARPVAQLRLWETFDEKPAGAGIRREGFDAARRFSVGCHWKQIGSLAIAYEREVEILLAR